MLFRNVKSRLVVMSVMLLGAMLLMAGPASAQALNGGVSNSAGGFSFNVTVPSTAVNGIYKITVSCNKAVYPLPDPTPIAVSVNDNVVVPGQVLTLSGPSGSCDAAVSVSATLSALSTAGSFNIAQVVVRTGSVNILVERDGTNNLFNPQNPFGNGFGNLFGGQVQQPADSRGPIVINNNNSSSSSSSAAAAAGGSGVVAPPVQQLARTGVDALPMAAAGAAIVLLGFILLTAGNRTRPAFGNFAE